MRHLNFDYQDLASRTILSPKFQRNQTVVRSYEPMGISLIRSFSYKIEKHMSIHTTDLLSNQNFFFISLTYITASFFEGITSMENYNFFQGLLVHDLKLDE